MNLDSPDTWRWIWLLTAALLGVAEAVMYSFGYAQGLQQGSMDIGSYIVVQLTRHLHSHARRYDIDGDGDVTKDDLQIALAQVGRSC